MKKKNLDVELASPNSFRRRNTDFQIRKNWKPHCKFKAILASSLLLLISPLEIYGSTSTDAKHDSPPVHSVSTTCTAIEWQGNKASPTVDQAFDQTINSILKSLKSQDATLLQSHYHPRLHITNAFSKELFAKINLVAKAPADASVFKMFRLGSANAAGERAQCSNYGFHPIFGYSDQIPVIIQILGANELSHFLIILVKQDSSWKIGASQYLQKTHIAKNSEMWLQDALQDQQKGNKVSAFSKLEIARRLIQDQRYIEDPGLAQITTVQNQFIQEQDWQKEVSSSLGAMPKKVQRINTILAKDGIGLLFIIEVAKEESLATLRSYCKLMANTLENQQFFKSYDAIKCSFTLPNEKFGEEGKLGGLYMNRADWQESKP